MQRTYVDRIGAYYDNLDKVIDWQEEVDKRHYDISDLVRSANYPNYL